MDVRTGKVCRKCGWEVPPAAGIATWLEGIVKIGGLGKLPIEFMASISPISVQEIQNINYLHVAVIRELKNIRAPHACPRTDAITGTESWKHLPVSSSLGNYT